MLVAPTRVALVLCLLVAVAEADLKSAHHHHKHHKKHDKKHDKKTATAKVNGTQAKVNETQVAAQVAAKVASKEVASKSAQEPAPKATEEEITGKMKQLEEELAKKEAAVSGVVQKGQIE